MTNIIKRDPFWGMFSMPHWFEDFDEFSTQRGLKIRETGKNIIAEAVVAGVPSKDVEVHIEDGILTIKAEAKKEEKGKGLVKSSAYKYYYTAALSRGQWNKAKADIKDGIVKVTIPLRPEEMPHKIMVKAKEE